MAYSYPLKIWFIDCPRNLNNTPDEISTPWFHLFFIMIASDHDKKELFKSKASKTLGVFDAFDCFLARLRPFYKALFVQRAMKDDLHQ